MSRSKRKLASLRSYPGGCDELATSSIGYESFEIGVTQVGAMSHPPLRSGMSQLGWELPLIRSYLGGGEEPATSLVKYELAGMGVTFDKELLR